MTFEKLFIALASAAAVLALVAIAWGLGFRNVTRLESEDAARRLVAEEAPGAGIQNLVMDKIGAAALAQLADGRLVVIRAMGDRFSARTMPAGSAEISRTETGVRVRFADLGFPELHLALDAPPPWLGARL
jgi:hypothetical protein